MDVNKCQRIPKGQLKKNNPEKLAKRRRKTKKNMRYYTTLYLDTNDYPTLYLNITEYQELHLGTNEYPA